MPTDATSDFDSRLKSVADAIETTLDRLLSPAALPGEVVRPDRLLDAMRYSTLGGGKRLRPFLVVETARLFGVDGEGPQIGDGEIDWPTTAAQLERLAPHIPFIPEIWQGHVNDGEGFWIALERLEQWF